MSIITGARKLASLAMKKYDASHDMKHVERVVATALYLAKSEGISDVDTLEVIELGAILHDVNDHKYHVDNKGDIHHLFKEFNYPDDKAQRVMHIVDNISFTKEVKRINEEKKVQDEYDMDGCKGIPPENMMCYQFTNDRVEFRMRDSSYHTPEFCCVQDADRLDALGATGIARCLYFNATKHGDIYDISSLSAITNITKLHNKSYPDTAIAHFYEKLLNLQYLMKTKEGKRLAIERTKIMMQFVSVLADEWDNPSAY